MRLHCVSVARRQSEELIFEVEKPRDQTVGQGEGNRWAGLFVVMGQQMKSSPPRLSWRDSLMRYFGFDPLIDSRGQEMRWVRRERPVKVV